MAKNFAQSKGVRGEREVIQLLQPIVDTICGQLGILEVPKMERNLTQTRGGGYDIGGIDWLALEVKRQETVNISVWWEQCLNQTKVGQEPVLMYKQNRKAWRIVMYGRLPVAPAGKFIRCPVDISLEAFMVYFEHRLILELQK